MGKIIRNEKIITPTQYIEKENVDFAQSLIEGDATEIVVPEGTEVIKPYAFYKSKNLQHIFIPSSVKYFGTYSNIHSSDDGYVFAYSNYLKSVDLSNLTNYVYVGYGLYYSFAGCNNMTEVKLMPNITKLDDFMFYQCSKLPNIEIPSSVHTIESWCFYGCKALTKMNFPGNITKLANQAFGGSTNITKFTFPNNTVVPTLSNISAIPNGANYIGQIAIPNSLYDTWTTATNWVSLTKAQWVRFIDSWDETITAEGDYALKTDTDLADVRHLTPAS